MKKEKIKIGLIIFALGFIGVLSMLTMNIALPTEVESLFKNQFTPSQIKLLILVNPSILLIVACVVGTMLYRKVQLELPIIEKILGLKNEDFKINTTLKHGVLSGVLAGVLLSLTGLIFNPFLPNEFVELGESVKPTLLARFLYGGITEEILMRFGLMTLVVWISSKIIKGTPSSIYWIGIVVSSIIFALGHFPVVFQALETPSMLLLLYVLIGNTLGGIVFGWLYWKKGLESAFIAHIFTHLTMLLIEQLFG